MNSKRFVAAAAFLASSATTGFAATLTGDDVSVNLTSYEDYGTLDVTVGAGADADFYGVVLVDLNAGPSGDILSLTSSAAMSSLDGTPAPVIWTFTDLDFSGGETLVGFNVTQSFSDVSVSFTENSLTVTYADVAVPSGTFLQGQFVTAAPSLTSTSTPAPVPLPASFPLLMAGLGGVWALRRRKKT